MNPHIIYGFNFILICPEVSIRFSFHNGDIEKKSLSGFQTVIKISDQNFRNRKSGSGGAVLICFPKVKVIPAIGVKSHIKKPGIDLCLSYFILLSQKAEKSHLQIHILNINQGIGLLCSFYNLRYNYVRKAEGGIRESLNQTEIYVFNLNGNSELTI